VGLGPPHGITSEMSQGLWGVCVYVFHKQRAKRSVYEIALPAPWAGKPSQKGCVDERGGTELLSSATCQPLGYTLSWLFCLTCTTWGLGGGVKGE
jgi:hypothetical protein